MSHEDCQMYWLRTGDTWTKINYTKKAEEWMKPLVKGEETGLVEIPGRSVATQVRDRFRTNVVQLVHRRLAAYDVYQEQCQ